LVGNQGNDLLIGGGENDVVVGGSGNSNVGWRGRYRDIDRWCGQQQRVGRRQWQYDLGGW